MALVALVAAAALGFWARAFFLPVTAAPLSPLAAPLSPLPVPSAVAGLGPDGGRPGPIPVAKEPGSADMLAREPSSAVSARAKALLQEQARLDAELRAQAEALAARELAEMEAEAAVERARQQAQSLRDRERHERIVADMERRAFSRARSEVSLTMYSTPWCGYCKRARAHMEREGIAFVEMDIEADRAARRRARELNPRGGVPTFDMDGQVVIGFAAKKFDAALDRAARRRMRR